MPLVDPKGYKIPCVILEPSDHPSPLFLIYFHSNAVDIKESMKFYSFLGTGLCSNVVGVEYPGYGMYTGEANQKQIYMDALSVYDYLIYSLKVPPSTNLPFYIPLTLPLENILVFGRSIGTAPAIYLSSKRKIGILGLISPFTSLKVSINFPLNIRK